MKNMLDCLDGEEEQDERLYYNIFKDTCDAHGPGG